MTTRFARGSVLAVLVTLAALSPSPAQAAYPGENGQIAWSRTFLMKPQAIWIMDPDGSNMRQISHLDGPSFTPVWSPNGKLIAFATTSNNDMDIWLMDAHGKHARNVSNDPLGPNLDPTWSPDGARLAYWRQNMDLTGSVWVMNRDGSGQTQLTDDTFTNQHPAWSPDGSTIAFISNRSGSSEIWLMNPDGTNLRQITDTPTQWEENPDWSPDGARLAYDSCASATYPCPGTPNNEIFSIRSDGSGRTRLTDSAGIDANPSWSPDGTQIVFRSDRAASGTQIWKIDSDGSDPVQLTFQNYSGGVDPDWQPLP